MKRFAEYMNKLFAFTMPFTHIGGYAANLGAFVFIARRWNLLLRNSVVLGLITFIVYGTIRSYFSSDSSIGLAVMVGYIAQWFLPFVLGYSLGDEFQAKKAVMWYIIILGAIVLVSLAAYIGIIPQQYSGGFELVGNGGLLKALRSHIALGALCVLSIAVLVTRIFFESDISKKTKWLCMAGSLMFFIAFILSGSRAYYIGGAVAGIMYGVYIAIVTRKVFRAAVIALIIGLCSIAIAVVSPTIRERLLTTTSQTHNVQERLMMYKVAVEEIKDRPVFGFGPGMGIKQTQYFEQLPDEWKRIDRHPALHNFYLNILTDFGVVGFIFILIIIFRVLRTLFNACRFGEGFLRTLAIAVLTGFVGVLVGDLFDTILRGPGVAMELFWMAGMVAGIYSAKERNLV